ncbi:ABC transporter ATP-binding protein [Lutispora thermophila]|uniref:ATP-binding cassette, subfamily B n=1 Tax=Lutispora thermophila DSM 19022 TaxID=1122184 RepID=A0A1M6D0T1_9FIRM|nr:ABC transporter ATP-binding protein [Lutispora thermophila]SHI66819.1 ATP-binding cassette, subfamily B [Lutispora thermophila DSM 19022]
MSYISEKRKEELLRRYGSKKESNANIIGRPGLPKGPGSKGPGGPRGSIGGGKPKNAYATINRLLAYIGRDKVKILFVFSCVLVSSLASLAGSYVLRPIINNLVAADRTAEEKINNLVVGILIMACIYMIGVLCSYLQQRIMIGVSQKALIKIREDLFGKIQKLPVKYHDTHTHGDVMSRFTNDLDSVGEMLNNTMSQIFSGVLTLIGTITLMFVTNWILALVTIVTVPLLVYAGGMIGKQSRKYFIGQQQALGAVNGYIEETVTGQKVIKVFCHEETAMGEFEFLSDDLRNKQMKAQFFGGIMGPVMGNLSQISYALSATIGGILCLTKNFDIGGLTIFTNYSRQFSRPISELSMQMNTIFSALAGAERVFEVMDEAPETSDQEDAIEICAEGNRVEGAQLIKGEVTLKNVTFGYVPGKTVLKNINVKAKPGQKIAFVGSTGAGKTTITNLINRFYEIEEGEILIDGINIKNIKKDSLRRNIAMVLQDTHLFSGTVRENIRYGRPDATDEEVITAAKIACAHSFIERLPQGYDTVLEGDGANLSQGERQLLNIARAAISKAPILILDEATSSVDTRTEKHIERGMDQLMKNRTTFVIAHRLSTVRNADQIIVLEHGEIIEQGTHDELIKMGGRYYQLYTGAIELD